MNSHVHDKKKELLACKEQILKDIKYFEKRIEEARSQKTNSRYFDDDNDSDSEISFLDMGPSIPELISEKGKLETCIHATQELTSICVLQSEVNIMVNDPVYEREPPVTEQGTWREVTADCRVDLVPFTITFYAHQSSRPFGPISYRGLQVLPVKTAHEVELSNSILSRVDTPSDAVEVLRSYAVAHRSRRSTLARLAEKYSNSLYMEPMTEGGYELKCGNSLKVSWTLENKWSHVAAFHHKMKFDLDYMDEKYVKIISQAHRALSDPTLETDERTRLISKIIATCLEAQGLTKEQYESMESDIESENLRKRHKTLDKDIKEPDNKKKKDSEIMAPPKSLPKKTKPKGKENNIDNKKEQKAIKRPGVVKGDDEVKKPKLSEDLVVNNSKVSNKDKSNNTNIEALKTVSENYTGGCGNKGVSKEKGGKKNIKVSSDKEKSKKKDNQDDVAKNNATNSKSNNTNEPVTILKKQLDDKAVNVNKNNAGSSKSTEKVGSIKNTTNKELLYNNTIKENRHADIVTSNKPVNVKKSNKTLDNLQDNNTAQDLIKLNNTKKTITKTDFKSSDKMNSDTCKTTASHQGQNIESRSQNNKDIAQETKVSASQKHIASKDKTFNVNNKISDENLNIKKKLTSYLNNNSASVDIDVIKHKGNKKCVIDAKVTVTSKSKNSLIDTKNVPTSGKKITKNVNIPAEKNAKTKSSDMKNNLIENLNANGKKVKSNSNYNKTKNNGKDDTTSKTSRIDEIESKAHNSKEKPTNSALSNHRPKSSLIVRKIVNKCDASKPITNLKQQNTQQNVVVENITSTKSKITNKIIENNNNKITAEKTKAIHKITTSTNSKNTNIIIEKTDQNKTKVKNNKLSNDKNLIDKKIASVNKLHAIENSENTDSNCLKQKSSKNKRKLRLTNSPIQKNKINILNPKNKISVDKLKETTKHQKDNENKAQKNVEKNKIVTKIPQKLMTVRDQIIKKNILRISPRKPHAILKPDSQNSSSTSQRSLQKGITGIPRLMNKPILK